ncbi:MAG: RDD family protein [FCB group bacterium]|nr:RDD family protein [FCB group bacterium]
MDHTVRFETPENIQVSYRLAGPGTRFIAFFHDALLIFLTVLVVSIILFISILALGTDYAQEVAPYIAAIVYTVGVGFVFIGYFAVFEWTMSGQTPGKRSMGIRVVMEEGFSLSFSGVIIRNIFRVVDTIPLLWVVPVVTRKTQRMGDLVGGTIVVAEEAVRVMPLRELLAARPPEETRYAFSGDQLARLRPVDVQGVETFLERRSRLHPAHRQTLLQKFTRGLTTRLEIPEAVPEEDSEHFLEDLLGAYGRREARELI